MAYLSFWSLLHCSFYHYTTPLAFTPLLRKSHLISILHPFFMLLSHQCLQCIYYLYVINTFIQCNSHFLALSSSISIYTKTKLSLHSLVSHAVCSCRSLCSCISINHCHAVHVSSDVQCVSQAHLHPGDSIRQGRWPRPGQDSEREIFAQPAPSRQ